MLNLLLLCAWRQNNGFGMVPKIAEFLNCSGAGAFTWAILYIYKSQVPCELDTKICGTNTKARVSSLTRIWTKSYCVDSKMLQCCSIKFDNWHWKWTEKCWI